MIWVLAAVVGYLIGSINPASIIARVRGVDYRSVGSGNPGATNIGRALGKRTGILVGALTLGSASPHLFNAFGGVDWRIPVAVASVTATAGAGLNTERLSPSKCNGRLGMRDAPYRDWSTAAKVPRCMTCGSDSTSASVFSEANGTSLASRTGSHWLRSRVAKTFARSSAISWFATKAICRAYSNTLAYAV